VDNRYYPLIIDRELGSQYQSKKPSTGGILSYTNPQAAETYIKRARKEQGYANPRFLQEGLIRRSPQAPFMVVQMPFKPAQCPLRPFSLPLESSRP
jgi:hypothetical protein